VLTEPVTAGAVPAVWIDVKGLLHGNLTLALLLRAREERLPLPAGAVALSPVADFTLSGDSVQRNDGDAASTTIRDCTSDDACAMPRG